MSQNNDVIVKSNQVIEASYQLSTTEQRIVLSAIGKIPKGKNVSDDEVYLVEVKDLEALGVHQKTAYRDLKQGVNRLYERSINLTMDDQSIKMRWVQSVRFIDSQGTIGLRFSKEILPFVSNLSREFTRYFLSDISGMNSSYGIRIYELLVQYRGIGKREIKIDELRKMLELGKKYPLFADLKRWVIDTAVEQINEHSPIKVEYEQKKTGRKVTHILFTFKEKPKKINLGDESIDFTESFIKMSDPQLDMFSNKLSRLNELGHLAEGNEDYDSLALRIRKMLQNKEQQKQFLPYLKTLGFKA